MTGIHSAIHFHDSELLNQTTHGALYNNHNTLLKTVHIYSYSPSLLYQLRAYNQTATHDALYNNHNTLLKTVHISTFTAALIVYKLDGTPSYQSCINYDWSNCCPLTAIRFCVDSRSVRRWFA